MKILCESAMNSTEPNRAESKPNPIQSKNHNSNMNMNTDELLHTLPIGNLPVGKLNSQSYDRIFVKGRKTFLNG